MIFRRRRRSPDENRPDALNMTPMIDVVFQLLIFFMLSMHFKEVEGKLISQMPKDKGPRPEIAPVDLREIRVVLCAGGDVRTHLTDKGKHERADKPADVCRVMVERIEIGDVYKSETQPGKAAGNKAVYQALGAKVKELYALVPVVPGRPAPVIIDADSEVPYEHVIGAVNAIKDVEIHAIEFTANPRHDRYYGSFQKGQFQRDRR
jgi:biopolymer transport protein ExbD